MSDIEPEKLKVVELRKELAARGLETKGNKPVLVKRLKQALNKEQGIEVADADVSVGELDTSQEDSQEESQLEEPTEKTDVPVQETTPVVEIAEEALPEETTDDNVEKAEEAVAMETTENGDGEQQEQKMEESEVKESETSESAKPETENGDGEQQEQKMEESEVKESETSESAKPETEAVEENGSKPEGESGQTTEEASVDDDGLPEEFQTIDETNDEDGEEKKDDKDRERRPSKRARSRSRSPLRRSRDRSRRSRSRERRRESPKVVIEEDDYTWLESTVSQLDRYNADLNMRIEDTGLKAHPLTAEGFAFMWAGVRGMFGVTSGKVAFEVKITENIKVEHLPSDEAKNVARVGWSVDSAALQLGEEPLSYGYGGTGKASVDCKFKDYGETYTAGDVITAYLDLDSEPATISYSKNGEYLDVCFEVDKEALGDKALYPHILTKNTEFEVNFGALETPWFPLREEFVFIDKAEKVRGAEPPAKKEECEIIMMVGLPGAGKTYWADKHTAANTEKRFNVLGTNNIIDKMKVMGLPRRRNYAGRWDSLIEKSMRCLNRLIEIAARKRRNYILDQTNVYASARRRKMQPFEGFQRKAVVVIPSDEDFKSRIAEREKEEGKDVPEKAVLEMKANFTLPEVGALFDAVEFTELDQEEGGKLVEKYMKEAKTSLPPPEKRFRGDRFGNNPRGRYDHRGHDHRGRGSYRGDRDRYGGRGGYRGGYRDGGYRDGGHRGGYQNRGSYNRYDSGGRYDNRNRYDSRSGGGHSKNWDNRSHDSRSSSHGGSWGGRQGSWGGSGHSGGWGGQSGWGGGQGQWGSSQSNYGNYNQGGYSSQSNQGYGGGSGGGQWGNSWGQNYWGGQGGSGYNQNSSYNQWYSGSGSYK